MNQVLDDSPGGTAGGSAASRRAPLKQAFSWLVAVLIIAAIFLSAERIELDRVIEVLRDSNLLLVGLAVAVNLTLNTFARVSRRRVLLDAASGGGPALDLLEFTRLYFASCAANNVLPARAGDLLFAVQLRGRGYRLAAVLVAQFAEKLVEVFSLWILILPTIGLGTMSAELNRALYLFLVAGLVGAALLGVVLAAAPKPGSAPRPVAVGRSTGALARWWRRSVISARTAMDSLRKVASPRIALRALAWSSAQDASDVLMVGLVALAVDVHVGPGGWLLVYLAVNLASALPSTPGQIGLIEAGALLALVGLGAGPNRAMAFALLYHAAHLIPTTLMGLPVLLRLRWEEEREPAPGGSAPSP